ncbi:type VI protein secretion system component VasF [Weissella uvarum]|uniref:hypothetical protein n=1 Tax=Weissella uvarum TaxID=1479233 RepID=UPI0019621053|nr:hypothetical protein [Weissella uvarum]MBM7616650.1 type VI protein secretion system component VasF [Weissella uvarum]MCM0594892.1 hypothetical protein [Weissella uvarum]
MSRKKKPTAQKQSQKNNDDPEAQLREYENHAVNQATDTKPTPYPLWVRALVIGMLLVLLFGVIAGAFYMFF